MLSMVAGLVLAQTPTQWPQTRPERTAYAETSAYADVIEFLQALKAADAPITITYMGKTSEGRPIPLVVASRPLVATPSEAKRSGKPVIYIFANIHAGEVEGKEAALELLRDWSKQAQSPLDKAIFVVAPIYNADGNEKLGPQSRNRPGQNGPEMVGVRPNGQNLDLNRDCMKARAPETRAALQTVYGLWDPDVVIDMQTTDGTRHGYRLTYSPPLNPNTDPGIAAFARDELLPAVRKEARSRWGLELFDYGNAGRGPAGLQWSTFAPEGRYVTNYVGLRNRISILSEAMVYEPFQTRIADTRNFVQAVVENVIRRSKRVIELTRAADARFASNPPKELGVRFDIASRGSEMVRMERAAVAGQPRPTGPVRNIEMVSMPVNDRFKAIRSSAFPTAYLFPSSEQAVADLLMLHGIRVERLTSPWSGEAQEFAISEAVKDANEFQGVRMTRLEGRYRTVRVEYPVGSYVVRTDQPLGGLIFNLLEPESLDGAAAWGFFVKPFEPLSAYSVHKTLSRLRAASEKVSS